MDNIKHSGVNEVMNKVIFFVVGVKSVLLGTPQVSGMYTD